MTSSEAPLVISRPLYIDEGDCGYCHGSKDGKVPIPGSLAKQSHISVGSVVHQMSCSDYDRMINRGFRRSGTFLYKTDMLRGCCRMYTIRTKRDQVKLTKEHRQVINRFVRAISDLPSAATPATQRRHVAAGQSPLKTSGRKAVPGAPAKDHLQLLSEAEVNSSRFHTRFEPAGFSQAKFELYKKYQVSVHKDAPDSVTEDQFERFLCDTPFPDLESEGSPQEWAALERWRETGPGPCRRIGPTHECYYLDGALIAISVLDFLPSGVSSVYLIWDPDHAHLSLGTLLALRELHMCHELGLGYYYLGYYIHDCAKMRYKAKFGGELLDVVRETFVPLAAVSRFMEHDVLWVSSEGSDTAAPGDSDTLAHGAGATKEPALLLTGDPPATAEPGANAFQAVYGNPCTYSAAAEAQARLESCHNVHGLDVPPVFPGAVPLGQLVTWLERGTERLRLNILDAAAGLLHRATWAQLTGRTRAAVVDFIRLYGETTAVRAIVVS